MAVRCLALRERDREVARAFGNAEIDRVDQRERGRRDDVEDRVPLAGLALHRDAGIGHHMALDRHVVRSGAAHAERAPGIEHLHVRRVHRQAEMQHHRAFVGVEDGAGHQDVAGRRAGGEYLAAGDAVAALDLLGLAGTADPVRAAARQEHDALGRDALEQRLDRGLCGRLMLPAPRRDRDLMRVHREREARSSRSDTRACAASRQARRRRRHRHRAPRGTPASTRPASFSSAKLSATNSSLVAPRIGAAREFGAEVRGRYRRGCARLRASSWPDWRS